MKAIQTVSDLISATFREWNKDQVSHLAAALSYYTIFSLAPILVIFIAIAGLAFGQEVVSSRILEQIGAALGQESALEIKMLIEGFHKPTNNLLASVLGGITLLWGSIGIFSELQNCFNVVWKVKPKVHPTWLDVIKNQFFSFTVVLGVGFLLLVSLLFSAVLEAITDHLHAFMPLATTLWLAFDFFISISGITFLFALIFKILPNLKLKWRDVFLGAFVTALLFTLGKALLSIYLAKSNIATSFGAAASLIVILVWVYYSAQILLLGAEFTKVYTHEYGSKKAIK